MFNKSVFNKREATTPSHGAHSPTPTASVTPAPSTPRPSPRPGTFGANMRSQFDTPSQNEATQPPQTTQTSQSTQRESKPATSAAKDTGSRLIVGPDVKLRGAEILDCDTLVVEGRVEATMDSRVIRIAENGSFSGKVGIDVAEIHGHFDGNLTAREQLIIHATGRVSGTIRYGKILIEEGGEVSGDVQSLTSAKSSAASDKDGSRESKPENIKPLMVSSS